MAEISITINGDKRVTRKLTGFSRALPGQLSRGFKRAGAIFIKDMRTKISGDGFSRNPARSSPYPGIKSGEMFRTLFMKVGQESGGTLSGAWRNVRVPEKLEPDVTFSSMPLADVISKINKDSNSIRPTS